MQGQHLELIEGGKIVDRLASNGAEDGVLAVQLLAAIQGEKELAVVAVRAVFISAGDQPPAVRAAS